MKRRTTTDEESTCEIIAFPADPFGGLAAAVQLCPARWSADTLAAAMAMAMNARRPLSREDWIEILDDTEDRLALVRPSNVIDLAAERGRRDAAAQQGA